MTLRYTNGLDSSYLSDKTTGVLPRPGSVRAGQPGGPSQEHQNPNEHWCLSTPLIGQRLPRCLRRLVRSNRCWCHECRMRDWRARRRISPALPPARRPARTPTPLCSLRGAFGAAIGAVTREREIGRVGVRCWCRVLYVDGCRECAEVTAWQDLSLVVSARGCGTGRDTPAH